MYNCLFKLALIAVAGFGVSPTALAQYKVTGKPLDAWRYDKHKGTPYQFDKDRTGYAVNTKGRRTTDVLINYNGFTSEFEVTDSTGARYAINEAAYPTVYVVDGSDTLEYIRGIIANQPKQYAQVLLSERGGALIKQWHVTEGKVTVENVGRTEEMLRFGPRPMYLLSTDGAPRIVTLRRKNYIRAFPEQYTGLVERAYKRKRKATDEERALAALKAYLEAVSN